MKKAHNNVPMERPIIVSILMLLALVNGVWFFSSTSGGPLVACIGYAVVGLRFMKNNHDRTVLIAGIAGLAIHIIEAFILNIADLTAMQRAYFLLNLLLPFFLIITAYRMDHRLH